MSFWNALQQVEHRLHWIDAGGIRTRVLEAGRGPDTLLMLHGVQGHLEVWIPNFARLSRNRRLVAIDMLGHGFTDKPDRPYQIADYVGHALSVLDALDIERASWMGSSLGGWVSAKAAATYPERVHKLVLVSTAGLSADPSVMAKLKGLGEQAASMPGSEGVRARLQYVIHDPAVITDELVEARWRIYRQDDYRQALPNINILQNMVIRQRNLLGVDELGRIAAPTLIVWTDHDPTASLDTGRRYQAAIPGSRFVVLNDCSHIPSLEKPEEFDREVGEFLDAL